MDKAFEKQITDLEMQFWKAMKDKDAEAAARLTGDTCIITGAQGANRIDRKMFAGMLNGATWILHDYAFKNVTVDKVTDDVAVVGYMVHEKLTVDGKPVEFDAADASTWVRRSGKWVCVLHTESIAGDPYGRDRKKQ
jgi:uncharacterized protein DUF4440